MAVSFALLASKYERIVNEVIYHLSFAHTDRFFIQDLPLTIQMDILEYVLKRCFYSGTSDPRRPFLLPLMRPGSHVKSQTIWRFIQLYTTESHRVSSVKTTWPQYSIKCFSNDLRRQMHQFHAQVAVQTSTFETVPSTGGQFTTVFKSRFSLFRLS